MDVEGHERLYEGKGIVLKGAEFYSKSVVPLGNVFFVPGLNARWDDYTPLLIPLAQRYHVHAYSQRGHGASPGKFDLEKTADDLESIIEREDVMPSGIIAHSLSAVTALNVAKRFEEKGRALQGVYLIQPLLDMKCLNWLQQAVLHGIYGLNPALRFIDDFLNGLKLREKLGFHVRDVIKNHASIVRMESYKQNIETPVGYMLADNDYVLGTNSKRHYEKCIDRLNHLFGFNDDSSAAQGLNHCLNFKKHVPFLRVEKGKPKDVVIFLIKSFFYNAFSKSIKTDV